jgi:3',5'-cyclic AMP phosphodiesterase CpdA
MKKIIYLIVFIVNISIVYAVEPFRFALITDLHIQTGNPRPTNDLKQVISELNSLQDIAFVLVSGDISESGDSVSLAEAKSVLVNLKAPYYITPGNHDTYSGGLTSFVRIFGDDKFCFTYGGFAFIGFATVPATRGLEAHINAQDINWVKAKLDRFQLHMPIIMITHYPLQTGDVNNWYDMTAVLRKYNVQAVLCGHYHRNAVFNFADIPGIVNRSVLRGRDQKSGYSVYQIDDKISVFEKITGEPERLLFSLPVEVKEYSE